MWVLATSIAPIISRAQICAATLRPKEGHTPGGVALVTSRSLPERHTLQAIVSRLPDLHRCTSHDVETVAEHVRPEAR